MAKVHCQICGNLISGAVDYDGSIDDWRCALCFGESDAADLLAAGRSNDPEFAELLAADAAPFRAGWADNEIQILIRDADEALHRGDRGQAIHLLERAAEPKFKSVDECKEAYAAAMAEKRGVPA